MNNIKTMNKDRKNVLNNKEAIWILMNSGGNGLIGRGK